MLLIKDDHVVETLTSNGANHPFDKWILPRGARCGKVSIIIICPGLDSRPGLPSSTCWRAWSAREGRC